MIDGILKQYSYKEHHGYYRKFSSRFEMRIRFDTRYIESRMLGPNLSYFRRFETMDSVNYVSAELDRLEKLVQLLR